MAGESLYMRYQKAYYVFGKHDKHKWLIQLQQMIPKIKVQEIICIIRRQKKIWEQMQWKLLMEKLEMEQAWVTVT